MQTWIIGSGAQCDLVVNSPGVSGRHCRLTSTADGYILEDLGSTNGTHVNGMRITTSCSVTRRDTITLGLTAPMPWPAESSPTWTAVLSIGREPDNDFVIDLPMVSGHHARVIWNGEPGKATIEDLNSSNGTAVGSPELKITRATFTASDTIYLGSYAFPAAQILARIDRSLAPALAFRGESMVVGRDLACDSVIDVPMVSGRHALLTRRGGQVLIKDLGSSNGTFVNGKRVEGEVFVKDGDLIGFGSRTLVLTVESPGVVKAPIPVSTFEARADTAVPSPALVPPSLPPQLARPQPELTQVLGDALKPQWRLPALLIQSALLAIVIVVAFKAPPPLPTVPATTKAATTGIASILFWVSLAAIWFGLSDVLLGNLLDRQSIPSGLSPGGGTGLIARLGVLVALGVLQCVLVWLVAASLGGLKAPAAEAIGLLGLACAVGMALGFLVLLLAPGRAAAYGALGVAVLLLWVFGTPSAQLWKSSGVQIIANALPGRWAFEGLLVLESDRQNSVAVAADTPTPGRESDLAEAYFPADSERMGSRADAIALTLMFIGLAAGAAFIGSGSKLSP